MSSHRAQTSVLPGPHLVEAPAFFKRGTTYYALLGGCTCSESLFLVAFGDAYKPRALSLHFSGALWRWSRCFNCRRPSWTLDECDWHARPGMSHGEAEVGRAPHSHARGSCIYLSASSPHPASLNMTMQHVLRDGPWRDLQPCHPGAAEFRNRGGRWVCGGVSWRGYHTHGAYRFHWQTAPRRTCGRETGGSNLLTAGTTSNPRHGCHSRSMAIRSCR